MSVLFSDADLTLLRNTYLLPADFSWEAPAATIHEAIDHAVRTLGVQTDTTIIAAINRLQDTRIALRVLLAGHSHGYELMKVDLKYEDAILDKASAILRTRARFAQQTPSFMERIQDDLTRAMIADAALRERVVHLTNYLALPHTAFEVMHAVRETFPHTHPKLPRELNMAIRMAHRGPVPNFILAPVVKFLVNQAIGRYVVADNMKQAFYNSGVDDLQTGISPIFDILGESVSTQAEADFFKKEYLNFIDITLAYHQRNPQFFQKIRAQRAKTQPLYSPTVHADVQFAIKFSMLTPLWDKNENPNKTKDAVKEAMRPILRAIQNARDHNLIIGLRVDPEHYRYNDILYDIFGELMLEEEFKKLTHMGIGVQAYLKESEGYIKHLAHIAEKRKNPLTIGLVKGAYHEHEVAEARAHNRPSPVFEEPWKTNHHYERMVRVILESPHLNLQAGTHNPRQQACVLALAEVFKKSVEIGMLEGLDPAGHEAHKNLKHPFAPYWGTGMGPKAGPYMARRFNEVTKEGGIITTLLEGTATNDDLIQHPATNKERDDFASYANDILDFAKWKREQKKKIKEPQAVVTPSVTQAIVEGAVATVTPTNLSPRSGPFGVQRGGVEIALDDLALEDDVTEDTEIDLENILDDEEVTETWQVRYHPTFKDNRSYNQIPGWSVFVPATLAAMNPGLLNSAMAFAAH